MRLKKKNNEGKQQSEANGNKLKIYGTGVLVFGFSVTILANIFVLGIAMQCSLGLFDFQTELTDNNKVAIVYKLLLKEGQFQNRNYSKGFLYSTNFRGLKHNKLPSTLKSHSAQTKFINMMKLSEYTEIYEFVMIFVFLLQLKANLT